MGAVPYITPSLAGRKEKTDLPVAFSLQVEEVGVSLVASHQFFVAAKLTDTPFRKDHDPVSHTHG